MLPSGMQAMQKKFTEFYLSQYEGRRLQWQHSLDFCLMKAQLAGSAKELSVSLFQALVLLLFNGASDDTAIPLPEIQVKTGTLFVSQSFYNMTRPYRDRRWGIKKNAAVLSMWKGARAGERSERARCRRWG